MSKEDWQANTLDKIFKDLYPTNITNILDVGCGLSFKAQYLNADTRVAFDIYPPYLEAINTDVDYITVLGDARRLTDYFLPDTFDLVIATDIIEHLKKTEGWQLLIDLETVAKKAVIVETPRGYIPQNIDIWGLEGHEYQTHKSGWHKAEFTGLGYHVIERQYKMSNTKRHTEIDDIELNIVLLDAIKILN